jgi:hypothetical protein
MKSIAVVAVLLAVTAAPVASQDSTATEEPELISGWRHDVTLYGWLAGLSGTIGVGDELQEPVDATFEDLAGMVDFALACHYEAKNSRVALIGDVSYTDLGSSRDGQVGNETVSVELDITQWIIEVGGGYRFSKEFLVLLATRYYILDMGATSTSIAGGKTGETEQDWGDIFIGARYSNLLRQKWIVSIRGDIGTGGSDFAWFGDVALGYRITNLLSGLVSYRVLSLDRQPDSDGNYFKYDVVQSGLGIGLGFSF